MELFPLTLLAFAVALLTVSARSMVLIARRSDDGRSVVEDADALALDALIDRRETLMALLVSTKLDHDMGKITGDDRDQTMARLKREVAAVMARIDALGGAPEDLEAADAAIAAERARGAPSDVGWSRAALLRHGGVDPRDEAHS